MLTPQDHDFSNEKWSVSAFLVKMRLEVLAGRENTPKIGKTLPEKQKSTKFILKKERFTVFSGCFFMFFTCSSLFTPQEKSRNFTSTSGYQSLKTTPAPHVTALIRQLRLARNACKLPSNLGAACWAQYLKVQVNIYIYIYFKQSSCYCIIKNAVVEAIVLLLYCICLSWFHRLLDECMYDIYMYNT